MHSNLQLFDTTAYNCSRLITQAYSTSFSLGIKTLGKEYRDSVYAIYGFVRYADEIVDTFHQHDKSLLLKEFTQETYKAIERGVSMNPILHSFQKVVNQYNIDIELINSFLESMEMDLNPVKYNETLYKKYIYGSAEVVGLMCLQIFCEGDKSQYEELKDYARSLGAAFQKVNFLRDLKEDHSDKGRVYFPGIDFSNFDDLSKKLIEDDIQKDFEHALIGIKKLPVGCRKGVYLAYRYYTKLFKKIKHYNPEKIQSERVRINDFNKAYIMFKSFARYQLNFF
jgi:phytoene/squalene synthetase